jgi:hypothetical protein
MVKWWYVTVYGKTRPKSLGKIWRKRGKLKIFFLNIIFFSKYAHLIHFIHPKVQIYIQKCHKIAPNVIKINSILYNSFIMLIQTI